MTIFALQNSSGAFATLQKTGCCHVLCFTGFFDALAAAVPHNLVILRTQPEHLPFSLMILDGVESLCVTEKDSFCQDSFWTEELR